MVKRTPIQGRCRHWTPLLLTTLVATLLGCNYRMGVRARAPQDLGTSAASSEPVGLYLPPGFATEVRPVAQGPFSWEFELGPGGSRLVREVLQARFSRVVELRSPTLPPSVHPELHGVLVPRWGTLSIEQLNDKGETHFDLAMDLVLQARDGKQVWSRSYSGHEERTVGPETGGTEAMAKGATAMVEELGEALAKDLARPEIHASLVATREADLAREAAVAEGAARKAARRYAAQPFSGTGPLAAEAARLQAALMARLTSSGRLLEVADPSKAQALDAATRGVNQDGTREEDWVAVGKARGAELLLSGELASAASRCTVKVELTELESRLVLASFFRPVSPCGPESLLALAEPAAAAILQSLPVEAP